MYHESSEAGVALGTWAAGDVFRIAREDSLVKYYRNGIELRSASVDPTKAYKIKALINAGGTFPTTASFWIPASRGQVPDAWEFAALKDLYDSLGGASWTNKGSWGAPNSWVTNITAAQMDAWYGIVVTSGDIQRIELRQNNLSGKLPSSIGTLKQLRRLLVDRNHLIGPIPSSIGNLVLLQWLYIHENNLAGNLDWISTLVNLEQLWFRGNVDLEGTIPASIGNLTKLVQLIGGGWIGDRNYVQMKMYGQIPAAIANCIQLEYLYLDNSNYSGQLPDISSLTKLKYLSLFNNPLLTGHLPTIVTGRTILQVMYLFNTGISGSIPTFTGFNSWLGFDLSNSQSRGATPVFANSPNMEWIGLESLQMTTIPAWGTSFPKLWYLNLKDNLLTTIPSFVNHANKANLELYVADNALSLAVIESNFTAAGVHPFKTFEYAPQRNPIEIPEDIQLVEGQDLVIASPAGGAHGVYSWEKLVNGSWVSVNDLNQSSVPSEFRLVNPSSTDGGHYRYTVTNTWVPGLSFESGPIEVQINSVPITSVERLYNGMISSARWRIEKVQDSADDYTGMYIYSYDDKYQIQEAVWATPNFITNTFDPSANKFRLSDMSYDANGNILSLSRYDENSVKRHSLKYHYPYMQSTPENEREYTNQIKSVDGYASEFEYDNAGRLIRQVDAEGNEKTIEYDVSGKVLNVYEYRSIDGVVRRVWQRNGYDERGFRLFKVIQVDPDIPRTTWYIRDAAGNVVSTFEEKGIPGDSEGLIQVDAPIYGALRIGTFHMAQDSSVSYELNDHLGNVRAILREDNVDVTATMEDNGRENYSNPRVQEMAYFQNLFETEVSDVHMNHTSSTATAVASPSRSAYLFWQDGVAGIEASDKAIGPAMARNVGAGDIITAEVYARYENKAGYTNEGITLNVLSSLLGSSFVSVGGFEGMSLPQTVQSFSNALGAGAFLDDTDDEVPYAYLNYIIFDEQMAHVASDRVRVTDQAGFDVGEEALPDMHEHVSFGNDIVIPADGKYIYIWVSNESENTKVWFDDLRITHASTFVAQATDYGVWGDVIREERSDVLARYRYGYQGQFAEKDEETGWNHFELREYDPIIGRFTTIDPMGQFWSAYIGMGNDPLSGVDPTGGCVDSNGNPVPCPTGIDETHNPGTTILDEVVIKPDLIDDPEVMMMPASYYGPQRDFEAIESQASFEAAVVVTVAYELWKSQFVSDNMSDDPNVMAMSVPSPGKINMAKILQSLQAARKAAKLVRMGRAPKGIDRIDIPKLDPNGIPLHGQQPHVHIKDGALNIDGTWKHLPKNEAKSLTNSIKQWLSNNGWELPK